MEKKMSIRRKIAVFLFVLEVLALAGGIKLELGAPEYAPMYLQTLGGSIFGIAGILLWIDGEKSVSIAKRILFGFLAFAAGYLSYIAVAVIVGIVFSFVMQIPILASILSYPVPANVYSSVATAFISVGLSMLACHKVESMAKCRAPSVLFAFSIVVYYIEFAVWEAVTYGLSGTIAAYALTAALFAYAGYASYHKELE